MAMMRLSPPLRRRLVRILLGLFLVLNAVAFMHAWAMTHFRDGGVRTHRTQLSTVMHKVWVLLTGVTVPHPVITRTPADVGLPFETRRFVSSDGVRLEGWRIRAADARGAVLLCHAYADCKSSLLEEAAFFHGLGYEVWLADTRGCGGSQGRTTSIGFYEAADVAAAWRDMVARTDGMHVIFGESMGSAAALRAVAVEGVRPDAMILENPFSTMLSAVDNRFRSFGLPAFPFSHLLVFWGGCQQGFWGFGHNPRAYAASVECPTMLMVGEHDIDATPEQVASIGMAVRGNCRVEVFAAAGHTRLVRADAERWQKLVRGFLHPLEVSAPAKPPQIGQ